MRFCQPNWYTELKHTWIRPTLWHNYGNKLEKMYKSCSAALSGSFINKPCGNLGREDAQIPSELVFGGWLVVYLPL